MTPREVRRSRTPMRRISDPSRLGPVRDTGLTVSSNRSGRRIRRRGPMPFVAILGAVLIVGIMLVSAAANRSPEPADAGAADNAAVASASPEAEPLRVPTPAFATYRSLNLRMPVDPCDVTVIAFHQASGDKAFHMESLTPDADMEAAAKVKAVATGASAETGDAVQTIWQGEVLRLWRSNRSGMPDTAADIGADPGSDVYSPVTGTVLQVRAYKLYDKYDDYEIHIKPDGWPEIDVVLIHVDDVSIAVGDRVVGGATRIACVRKMSDKIDIQLGGYTKNGGDHVHMQLNEAAVPGKPNELDGS